MYFFKFSIYLILFHNAAVVNLSSCFVFYIISEEKFWFRARERQLVYVYGPHSRCNFVTGNRTCAKLSALTVGLHSINESSFDIQLII